MVNPLCISIIKKSKSLHDTCLEKAGQGFKFVAPFMVDCLTPNPPNAQ
jgi:hypothetical protein